MLFNSIWNKITEHQGEIFHTCTGLPFTYHIYKEAVITDRANQTITRSNFEKAYSLMPLSGPSQINAIVRGPAYVYSILTDARISG